MMALVPLSDRCLVMACLQLCLTALWSVQETCSHGSASLSLPQLFSYISVNKHKQGEQSEAAAEKADVLLSPASLEAAQD